MQHVKLCHLFLLTLSAECLIVVPWFQVLPALTESRCRLSLCMRWEGCQLPVLKTAARGLLVQLGFNFLASLSAAVTYLALNASQKQMFRHRSMEHERPNVPTFPDLICNIWLLRSQFLVNYWDTLYGTFSDFFSYSQMQLPLGKCTSYAFSHMSWQCGNR